MTEEQAGRGLKAAYNHLVDDLAKARKERDDAVLQNSELIRLNKEQSDRFRADGAECQKRRQDMERINGELLAAADALLKKFSTPTHPVEKGWEKEFLSLELMVADRLAVKRNEEASKCGVCGAEIKGHFTAVKEAWDEECEWYVCADCRPRHTH